MRLVFFGSGAFGLPTLGRLASAHTLMAIVTQPDKPAGRSRKLTPTPVAQWAAEHAPGIPVLKPAKVNEPGVVAELRSMPADAFVVIAFGQKLGRALLADRFAINLHASLLPRWRGAAPINHAILAGDVETGNSVITLADTMDAGLILGQSRLPIGPGVTAGELHDRLAGDGPDLVESVLAQHSRGTMAPRPQDQARVTLAPKLSRSDSWVDFAQPADACRRRIHALNPWPGATVTFQGEPLKLLRAASEPESGSAGAACGSVGEPGLIVDGEDGIVVCGTGGDAPRSILRLLEIQPAGRRPMEWADFARGRRFTPGERLIGKAAC